MLISRNPAVTLELCFAWQKLRHSDIDPAKPSDYVPRGGARYRLTRDKEGNLLTIPTPRHDVTESKRGRASTTNRVATGIMIGRVLAAATNQPPALANFLRFMYDPECPLSVLRAVETFAQMKMRMLVPERAQQVRRERCAALVWPLLLDFSQRVRTGLERYTEAQLCQYMGFVNKRDANYDRDYKRLVGDFMLQLQDTEALAIAPVCKVVDLFFRDGPAVRQMPALTPAAEPVQPERRIVVKHGTTLSLKRAKEIDVCPPGL